MLKVAVIIPCFNEEASVGAVINGFRATLPNSDIYVYDNGSTDNSVKVARKRIVHVSHVARREKGNVVRQAFADVEADIYIMVDGDDTYDPTTAPVLVNEVMHNQCDMVTVCRIRGETSARALPGHLAGNALFSRLVQFLFRSDTRDVLSGYHAFSRRFVKSFPSTARGFDIEVQITAQAAMLRVKEASIESVYRERTDGTSKLRTVRGGSKIMVSLFRIYRAYAPSRFFGTFSAFSILIALTIFVRSSEPSDSLYAISAFSLVSFLFFVVGIILNGITRIQYQQNRLSFLRYPRVSDN